MGLPTLSVLQHAAVRAFAEWYAEHALSTFYDPLDKIADAPVFSLMGFAGSGKSTILPVMIDAIGLPLELIRFAAPTGKAAKVMTEKLAAYGIDRRAGTIHSLIYTPRAPRAELLEKQLSDLKGQRDFILQDPHSDPASERLQEIERSISMTEHDLEKAYSNIEGPKFTLNLNSDLRQAKLLVIDEGSMVGTTAADDLRSFGVPILVMGDPGQLPPVGEPPGLTDGEPDFFLHEVHRQAKDNPILHLATLAREGKPLKIGRYSDDVHVIGRAKDNATYNLDRDAQIIVGTNARRWRVTTRLRHELGFISSGPQAGEPMIICKNSRTIPDLVNGAFVTCVHDVGDLVDGSVEFHMLLETETKIQMELSFFQGLLEEHRLQEKGVSTGPKGMAFRSRRDNEHADWGWAITCHKSQGSQWDEVVLHDESGVFREDWKKWLYTGITRAAKRLTVVL